MKFVLVVQDRSLQAAAERFASLPAVLDNLFGAEGAATREKTIAAETAQTNLSRGTLQRAQHLETSGKAFSISSEGGNVRLKYFHPREGGGGVTADPWGADEFYPGAFMTSGRMGKRFRVKKLNGQVYQRATSNPRWNEKRPGHKAYKSPIVGGRSGLYIPDEMVKDATLAAFEGSVATIADRLVTRLGAFV